MNIKFDIHPSTPPDLRNVNNFIIQRLVELMCLYGITGITTTWEPVGMAGALNIEMTTMDAEPKGSFLTMRPKIVRLLAELMQAHGILSLEAEVEPEDTARLVTMWNATVKTPGTTLEETHAERTDAPPTDADAGSADGSDLRGAGPAAADSRA